MKKYFTYHVNIVKHIGIGALCAFAAIAMVSCKDEPDDNSAIGSSQSSKAIIDFDGNVLSYVGDNKIYYDSQGRVEEIHGRYNDDYLVIDYSRGKIDSAGDEGNIKFNKNGYISEMEAAWEREDGKYKIIGNSKYVFNYNSSGYLTSIKFTQKDKEYDSDSKRVCTLDGSITTALNWSGGNLISSSSKWVVKEDGVTESWTIKCDFYYGSETNAFGQIPFTVSDYAILGDNVFNTLASTGLFGKGPKNLPTSLEEIEDGESTLIRMDFSLNSNGSINSESSRYNTYRYGYATLDTRANGRMINVNINKGREKNLFDRFQLNHRKKKVALYP